MARPDSLALAAGPPVGGAAELRPARAVVPPFAEVYKRYFDFVWSSARHLGVGNTAIDDVVQEAFIVIHERLHTVQQPESLRSWIYGVVRRTVSGHRRAHRPEQNAVARYESVVPMLGAPPTTPLAAVEHHAQLELLSNILAELDEAKREVFVLAELEEMSVPEIAEALEIPLNTAYSRLRAARQAFEAGLSRRAARLQDKGLR